MSAEQRRNTQFYKEPGKFTKPKAVFLLRWHPNQNLIHRSRPASSRGQHQVPSWSSEAHQSQHSALGSQADSRTKPSLFQRQWDNKTVNQGHCFKTAGVGNHIQCHKQSHGQGVWGSWASSSLLLSPPWPAPAPTSPASHLTDPGSGCCWERSPGFWKLHQEFKRCLETSETNGSPWSRRQLFAQENQWAAAPA